MCIRLLLQMWDETNVLFLNASFTQLSTDRINESEFFLICLLRYTISNAMEIISNNFFAYRLRELSAYHRLGPPMQYFFFFVIRIIRYPDDGQIPPAAATYLKKRERETLKSLMVFLQSTYNDFLFFFVVEKLLDVNERAFWKRNRIRKCALEVVSFVFHLYFR